MLENDDPSGLSEELAKELLTWNSKDGVHLYYSNVLELMDILERDFPELIQIDPLGQSYEGRNIFMIKVSLNSETSTDDKRSSMMITGAHHPREMISV
mmetsp:Transcript_63137/g.87220  ORF Transcript_63137/g.87220 Transcript_63137/m.87220 type:complete len:98 (-) Transcript_63137:1233-1526(-)